jgi:hypothetical protein
VKKLFQCSCKRGLAWVEFKERGCPAKKKDYFLTEKEILEIAKSIKKKEQYDPH